MVDPIVEPYDIGPMPVLLVEAGGRFTDLSGADTIEGRSGIATNGHLHDELLALLSSSPARSGCRRREVVGLGQPRNDVAPGATDPRADRAAGDLDLPGGLGHGTAPRLRPHHRPPPIVSRCFSG